MKSEEMVKHLEGPCPELEVQCPYEHGLKTKNFSDHLRICPKRTKTCNYCQFQVKMDDLQTHRCKKRVDMLKFKSSDEGKRVKRKQKDDKDYIAISVDTCQAGLIVNYNLNDEQQI
jgi:hypothetical protein